MRIINFLNRLFGSATLLSRDLEINNEEIIKDWEAYAKTIGEKKNITDNFPIDTKRLCEILKGEAEELFREENAQVQVIKDLKSIKHEKRIARAHRLTQTLDYAEAKYTYVYKLLEQIYSIIKTEIHLLDLSEKEPNSRKLSRRLQNQVSLEQLILEKVKKIDEREGPDTFRKLFLELIKGEVVIAKLDYIAKRHFERMNKIFSNEIPESITVACHDFCPLLLTRHMSAF